MCRFPSLASDDPCYGQEVQQKAHASFFCTTGQVLLPALCGGRNSSAITPPNQSEKAELGVILVPSSDAVVSNSFLLLLVRHLLLEVMHLFLVAFLVPCWTAFP